MNDHFYSWQTLQQVLNLPGFQLVLGVYFLMEGLRKAVEALQKFLENGEVPWNKKAKMSAAMYCALNVTIILFLCVTWLSALTEILSLSNSGIPYAKAYVILIPPLTLIELALLTFVYRGLWLSIIRNGNQESGWLQSFRAFRSEVATFHTYLVKRGVGAQELVMIPLGATSILSASFWMHLVT